jgi:hypothetical protein
VVGRVIPVRDDPPRRRAGERWSGGDALWLAGSGSERLAARRVCYDPAKREPPVDDKSVLSRINELAAEEHSLFEKEAEGPVSAEERARMEQLKVTLDQCWDLLRQRRARREFGANPDEAAVRSEGTVEGYVG